MRTVRTAQDSPGGRSGDGAVPLVLDETLPVTRIQVERPGRGVERRTAQRLARRSKDAQPCGYCGRRRKIVDDGLCYSCAMGSDA